MAKKIIAIAVILIMVFSFAACDPPNGEEEEGMFYSLQEAYDEGLLMADDLKDIAYYAFGTVNDENSDDIEHMPKPKTPENLSEETERKIKENFAEKLRNYGPYPMAETTAEGITIDNYCGTYNGSIAVDISYPYGPWGSPEANPRYYVVCGIRFVNRYEGGITIWK